VASPQRRLQFRKICRVKYGGKPDTKPLANLMVVRDVRTRWNYTHAMIRRALLLKEVSQQSGFFFILVHSTEPVFDY
jgi:hypothetical protein